MERRASLSLSEWAVLACLAERDRHGYVIAAELAPGPSWGPCGGSHARSCTGRSTGWSHWVWPSPGPPSRAPGGRPAEVFEATDAGRDRLEGWLAQPVEHLRDVRSAPAAKRCGAVPSPERRHAPAGRGAAQALRRALGGAGRATKGPRGQWRHHSAAAVAAFIDALAGAPPDG